MLGSGSLPSLWEAEISVHCHVAEISVWSEASTKGRQTIAKLGLVIDFAKNVASTDIFCLTSWTIHSFDLAKVTRPSGRPQRCSGCRSKRKNKKRQAMSIWHKGEKEQLCPRARFNMILSIFGCFRSCVSYGS